MPTPTPSTPIQQTLVDAPPPPPTIRFHKLALERRSDNDTTPLTPRGTPVALWDPVARAPRNQTLYAFVGSYLCGRRDFPDAVMVKPFVDLTKPTAPIEFWPAAETVVVDGDVATIARAFPGGETRAPVRQPALSNPTPPTSSSRRARR